MAYVAMKQMLETGVHFGHQTRRWNPKMKPYIFGARNGIHIIDLQQTVKLYRDAHDRVVDAVYRGGSVIFIGTKRQAQEAIITETSRAGQLYVANRWMGGTLTNFATIQKSIDRMKHLESLFEDGTIERYQKKEILLFERELGKLKAVLGGIRDMRDLPKLAFVIDPQRESIAIKECHKLGIPIIALTDTNCDPDLIDYVIPGNDDAIRAIKLFVKAIADACLEGEAMRKDGGKDADPEKALVKAAQAEAKKAKVDTAVKAETPALKAEAPAVKAEAPAVKAEAPAVKAEAPALKAETPALKAEAPAVKAEAPALKAEAPALKAEAPAVKAEAPAVKAEAPAVKAEAPAVKAEAPAATEEKPAAENAEVVTE